MPIYVCSKVPCDVCRLVDDNPEPKNCKYCHLCDAWICEADEWAWSRRARAFLKHRKEPNFKGDPGYRTGDVEADKIIESDLISST